MLAQIRMRSKMMSLFALVLALAALFAACEPEPTATPVPTPTPTPIPDPIINLTGDATFADLEKLLPVEAVRCISGELGAATYEALLEQRLFDQGLQLDADFPVQCFTSDVFVSVLIATLSEAAGGLSNETIVCIRETFDGLDLVNIANLAGTGATSASLSQAMSASIGLLLCLSDSEAERITAGGLFGDVGGASAISMSDLRCVLQEVDVNALIGLFETIEVGGTPDLSTGLTLISALSSCGIDLNALTQPPTSSTTEEPAAAPDLGEFDLSMIDQLPPEGQEMLNCLVGVLGEDKVNGLLDGSYTPAFEDIAALGSCNLDLSALGDIGSLTGS